MNSHPLVKLREPFLDRVSFESMLAYLQKESIPDLVGDLGTSAIDRQNIGHALYDLGSKHLRVALLSFSGGLAVADMVRPMKLAIDAFDQNIECESAAFEPVDLSIQTYYVEALWLLALTKLLGMGDDQIERVANFYAADETNDGADELFEALLAKLGRKSFPAEGLIHEDPYQYLLDCIKAEPADRPALMTQFLKRWFKGQKECDWWGSHIPRKGTTVLDTGFFGYWAFEAALVTYLWDIDDTSYRDLPHYPKDLVDYARANVRSTGAPDLPTSRLRCEGGQPCPQSGFWSTPALPNSRRRFNAGELMPIIEGSAWGATIWYWDEQQGE